jgi:hypothetical protein
VLLASEGVQEVRAKDCLMQKRRNTTSNLDFHQGNSHVSPSITFPQKNPPTEKSHRKTNSLLEMDQYIGTWVEVSVEHHTFTGQVYAVDKVTSTLILTHPQDSGWEFHVISTPTITEISKIDRETVDPPAPKKISLEKVSQREEEAFRSFKQAQSRIPTVEVSPEGQALFDALAKTMPVRWDKERIVVLEEVVLVAPYDVASVKMIKGKKGEGVIGRVKKIVEGERQRLGIK